MKSAALKKKCQEARTIIADYHLENPVSAENYELAKQHIKHCADCTSKGLDALRRLAFGRKLKVSCTECSEQLDDFVAAEAVGKDTSAEFSRVLNHLAYCDCCLLEYKTLISISQATEEELKSIKYPKFDLSFLHDKKEAQKIPKLVVRFLKDFTVKVLEATEELAEYTIGKEPIYISPKAQPMLAMRTLPSVIGAKEKKQDKIDREFWQKEDIRIAENIWTNIRLARDKQGLNDIYVDIFSLGQGNKRIPRPDLLIKLRGSSEERDIRAKTSIRGMASFKEPPDDYILGIYDRQDKLIEIELDMQSE